MRTDRYKGGSRKDIQTQEGLVSLLGKECMRSHFVVAVAMGLWEGWEAGFAFLLFYSLLSLAISGQPAMASVLSVSGPFSCS